MEVKMKGLKKYMAGILVAGMVLGSAAVPAPVYATEAEDAQEDNGDDVEITLTTSHIWRSSGSDCRPAAYRVILYGDRSGGF